jgi:hypothetical protein
MMAAAIAWLLFELRNGPAPWLRQLERELRVKLPVFSAETIHGREAEFIRDRLPKRMPSAIFMLSALLLIAAAVWWWLA